ncbi:MAG: phosphoribosylformylglycinamidine synthase subunit PurS [Actinomycetota bacterium]
MTFEVAVDIMPRQEISDPQGQTIERALPRIGFPEVSGVRVGKRITLSIEAIDERRAIEIVEGACRKFLTNPAIEEFSVSVSPGVSN